MQTMQTMQVIYHPHGLRQTNRRLFN